MELKEAKSFVGKDVQVSWTDRKGSPITKVVQVYEVNFVPMYGPCLITDAGNIQLDRVVGCALNSAAA
jgi:hypothetical protein